MLDGGSESRRKMVLRMNNGQMDDFFATRLFFWVQTLPKKRTEVKKKLYFGKILPIKETLHSSLLIVTPLTTKVCNYLAVLVLACKCDCRDFGSYGPLQK